MYSLQISLNSSIDLASTSFINNLKLAIVRVGSCCRVPLLFGMHDVLDGEGLEEVALESFLSVPVLIRRHRLGSGECLPGLLWGGLH